jgi:hypothetical protein
MKGALSTVSILILLLFAGLCRVGVSHVPRRRHGDSQIAELQCRGQVTLTNQATDISVSSTSSSGGAYVFDGLVPGPAPTK